MTLAKQLVDEAPLNVLAILEQLAALQPPRLERACCPSCGCLCITAPISETCPCCRLAGRCSLA